MRQNGHFTAQQAKVVGLMRPALHHQVRAGFIVRRLRGVYRFVAYPPGAPYDVVVHKAGLAASDVRRKGILRYPNPLRTLLDGVADAYPDDQFAVIHRLSLARGLVRCRELDPASPQVRVYVDRQAKARAQRVRAWRERAEREA